MYLKLGYTPEDLVIYWTFFFQLHKDTLVLYMHDA